MIRSYRDAEMRRLMERQASRKYKIMERTALIRLRLLNAATSLSDLRLPGLHLEPLKADRKRQYSIRVNDRRNVSMTLRHSETEFSEYCL